MTSDAQLKASSVECDIEPLLPSAAAPPASTVPHGAKCQSDSQSPAALRPLAELSIITVCGVIFGFALHKGGVYRADVIRRQFTFEENVMLQMFLSAAAFSVLFVNLMYYIPSTRDAIAKVGQSYTTATKGVPFSALGAFLLGSGMAIAGSCPGTIWAQLGAGSVRSLITLSAGVVSAFVYAIVSPYFKPLLAFGGMKTGTVFALMGTSRAVAAVLFAALLLGVTFAVGLAEPLPPLFSPIRTIRWSPVMAGFLIGMLQVPILLAVSKSIGCSSTFMTAAANVTPFLNSFPALNKKRGGMSNWWQVTLVLTCALGSYLAHVVTPHDPLYDIRADVSVESQLIGGFIMVFGARMGDGCTSGHGISGMGHLALRSLISVAAMFAGGIATTFAFGLA